MIIFGEILGELKVTLYDSRCEQETVHTHCGIWGKFSRGQLTRRGLEEGNHKDTCFPSRLARVAHNGDRAAWG